MHVGLQTKESVQRYNEASRRAEETERELVEMEKRAQDSATKLVRTKQQLRWTQIPHIDFYFYLFQFWILSAAVNTS